MLSAGYVPLRTLGKGLVEPGDMTKFMSVPWHTDYNSCATHPISPSVPNNNTTLYWSVAGLERPVNVHLASEVTAREGGQPGVQPATPVRDRGTAKPQPGEPGPLPGHQGGDPAQPDTRSAS